MTGARLNELLMPSAPPTAAIQVSNCVGVSAIAFILWDICITLDQEAEQIWSQSWSRTKILYFICRYLPVTLLVSTLPIGLTKPPDVSFTHHDCFIWQLYQLSATMIIFSSVEFIMLLRVEALYNQHRLISLTLRTLYYVEIILMTIGIGTTIERFRYDTSCLSVGLPPMAIIFAVVMPVNQTLLFTLTSIRFVQGVRQYGWGMVPLVELLMRDGTWSFFLIEVLLAANGVFYFVMSYPYGPMLYCYLIAGVSFVGYRVILNLRQDGVPSGPASGELSSIVVFASPPPLEVSRTTITRNRNKTWS
ncbi:hypothetical protein PTI98_006121 [Pleurotus ostreatus]|nr:hypothetical protein PTI98_006121 [Pleurotus ostreatus]